MKEFLLDTPLTPEFFSYLADFGIVESVPEVGNGFYRFEKADWFSIRGFVGDDTVEVRFKREVMDLIVDFVYLLFASYQKGPLDLSILKRREQALGERVQRHVYGS
jgi:hypothetical protein